MKTKPPPLSSNLVARKGQAAPPAPGLPAGPPPAVQPTVPPPPSEGELTAMTLKLDDSRYQRLKQLGMRRPRRTSQDILVAALDAYLAAEEA